MPSEGLVDGLWLQELKKGLGHGSHHGSKPEASGGYSGYRRSLQRLS
jgi:hypothetical protein